MESILFNGLEATPVEMSHALTFEMDILGRCDLIEGVRTSSRAFPIVDGSLMETINFDGLKGDPCGNATRLTYQSGHLWRGDLVKGVSHFVEGFSYVDG